MTNNSGQPTMTDYTPKPKKKNKKKKASQKQGQSTVSQASDGGVQTLPGVVEPEAPPTFILPVKPDEWLVVPEEDGEPRFVFYSEGVEIISLPFTEENFSGLHTVLRNTFPDEDTVPDHWNIAAPLEGEDPVMSLTKNGKLLAASTLDQAALKRMVKALNSHIIRTPSFATSFSGWWLKHKVLRIFLSLAMLPVFITIIYAIIWGIRN
jgi:hypothetical protein